MNRHVRHQDEVLVCKALKRAYGAYLGELAGPLCEGETEELWKEAEGTIPSAAYEVRRYVANFRAWDPQTAFNLGKVYKLCPSPDSSPASTILERYSTLTTGNKMSANMEDRFRIAHRDQMLRAYIASPGVRLELRDPMNSPSWFGFYRMKDLTRVPSEEIHDYLAWEGTAVMPTRSPLNPACWKDSGLGWDSLEIAMDPERDSRHGNMISRMVYDNNCPMPGVRYTQSVHYHKIEQKPEGHKVPLRAIYSSNLMDRLIQSWMEAAVYQVSRNHPAFMIGANVASRDARVSTILHRNLNHGVVDVYYSFDIKGWSPLMPAVVQRISHENWGALYNEEMFYGAKRINEMSTVYMNKRGYTGWFINPGANFEGYNAKEMTFELITLMAMAVGVWRTRAVEQRLLTDDESMELSAVLMAYIDDGLAKATLPRAKARVLFELWKKTTIEVFDSCGFTLEVNKCYPSDRFSIFLNEVYYMGRHITHGTRAAMTMCSENIDEKITLLEKITAVATGARGAVVSGLDSPAAHVLMMYHAWPHLRSYLGRPDPKQAAVWSFAPVSWGGLGMPSMLQLATTGGGASTEESAYTLQCYARHSDAAKNFLRSCVSEGYRARTMRGVITAPLGGSVKRGVLRADWVSSAVRESLNGMRDSGELSTLARDILSMSDESNFSDVADGLLAHTKVIQEQVLNDLYRSLPHQIFAAFCSRIEKGSTLKGIIGYSRLMDIRKRERISVEDSYRTCGLRIRNF